ncbi:putative transmembrane protein [Trypanosoma rangeli]|uniref:Putative transmembrane protein n=1 Tax=Trypanosoma rangeli TaxID=5698 RepID=A0A422NH39_TRYRA|nr:putative transmembrane protein [Trypanosoma rangeli]RNF04775.1 putative transmembrane protein [Trypanosoma rangeli]|eukprot:RNF04775.1 putative transmembrane protein [Trypanosoma rangeli]
MASPFLAGVLAVGMPLGGVMGYRKGSVASLIAGSLSGALMGVSTLLLMQDPAKKMGNRLAATVTFIVAFAMGQRYYKRRKLAPLIVASVNALSFLLVFGPNSFSTKN